MSEKPGLRKIKEYLMANGDKIVPLQLGAEHISEPMIFVRNHVKLLENNPGNRTYKAYYDRLHEYYLKVKE